MAEIPETDWAAIESALIDRHPLDPPRPPLTWRDIYMQKTGREPLFTGVVVSHEFQCAWKVVRVRSGRVTWRCWCGRRQERQVRVYGILPAKYLFVRRTVWTADLISSDSSSLPVSLQR